MKAVLVCLIASLFSVSAHSQTPSELATRAEQLIRHGDKTGAVKLLAQAALASPASAEAEDRIGFLLAVLGQKADAVAHFQKSSLIDATYAAPHYHLGVLLWQSGDRDASVAE